MPIYHNFLNPPNHCYRRMAFFHCMFYGRFFQFSRQEYGLHLPRFLCHFLINYQFLSQNTILTTTGQPFDKRLINFSIFRIIVCLSILLNKGVPKFDKLFFVFIIKLHLFESPFYVSYFKIYFSSVSSSHSFPFSS